jgi:hypothetical protein
MTESEYDDQMRALGLLPLEQLPHEERQRNECRRTRDGSGEPVPCIVCSRPLTEKAQEAGWWIHLVRGGYWVAPTGWVDPDGQDPGDVGMHAVGSECARRIPRTHRTRAG